MRTRLFIASAVLFLISCPAWAASTLITDQDFEEIGWEEILEVRPPPDGNGNGSGSGTAFREIDPLPEDNDDEDMMRLVSVVRDPDAAGEDVSTRLYSLARDSGFNPSITGAISSVTLSVYGLVLGDGTGGTVEPTVYQGDTLFVASGAALTEQAWTEKSFMSLGEEDFAEPGDPDSHPDFSTSGGEILFGFAYIISAEGGQRVESTVGFDDFELLLTHGGIGANIITAGINDAWFEPATNGQGFFITALPDQGIVFLSWFTFDSERPPANTSYEIGDPGHRWFTAQGPYVGDTAFLDVYETTGGVIDSPQPSADIDGPIGTMVVVWQSCTRATLDYDLPGYGLSGRIELERIADDNAALCVLLSEDDS
jgi:hypothetical protein